MIAKLNTWLSNILTELDRLVLPRPELSLVDLKEYESHLRESFKVWGNHHMLLPPPPIPGLLVGDWTDDEMAIMEANRKQALAIYDRARTWSSD